VLLDRPLRGGKLPQPPPPRAVTRSASRTAHLFVVRPVSLLAGKAHRGANGVAMPTDEDDQDGHFFYNHPERGAYFAA